MIKVGDKVVVAPKGWWTSEYDRPLEMDYPRQERFVPPHLIGEEGIVREHSEFLIEHFVVTFLDGTNEMLTREDLELAEIYHSKLRKVLA